MRGLLYKRKNKRMFVSKINDGSFIIAFKNLHYPDRLPYRFEVKNNKINILYINISKEAMKALMNMYMELL